jgi:hypothetical protein
MFNGNIVNLANSTNNIGGVTLSGGNISNASTTSNSIGGVTLSGGNIFNASTTSNSIGGVTLSGGNISNASTTSNKIGGVTLSGGNISNATNTSNSIGAVTLTNDGGVYVIGGQTTTLPGPYLRIFSNNAGSTSNYAIEAVNSGTNPPTLTLNGSNVILDPTGLNGKVVFNGNITTLANSSNSIGGVTLSGGITTLSQLVFYGAGGVTLSATAQTLNVSGNIVNASTTSNNIGGVTLSNNDVRATGTISGGTLVGTTISAGSTSYVGGVTLNGGALTKVTTINADLSVRVANITMQGKSTGQIWLCPDANTNTVNQGGNSIAIGAGLARTEQNIDAIAIGASAGSGNSGSQADGAIAIGSGAASTGQSSGAISIGKYSGASGQNAVALGINSKASGSSSIAIGANAGASGTANNTIIINATGANIDTTYSTQANSLFVAPIRNVTIVSGLVNLAYNPTTKEVVQEGFGVVVARGSVRMSTNVISLSMCIGCTATTITPGFNQMNISFNNTLPDAEYTVTTGQNGTIYSSVQCSSKTSSNFIINATNYNGTYTYEFNCDFVVIR